MMSAAEANDMRHSFISIAAILAYFAHGRRCSRCGSIAPVPIVHALGSPGLRFTPGWAVGWYFVPIANLWKPYQAMKEIWRASKNPGNWQAETTSGFLGWWWFWWIISVDRRQHLGAADLPGDLARRDDLDAVRSTSSPGARS